MNKSIFSTIKRILTGACVFYTVFMTATYVAGYFILENPEYLSMKSSFSFLLFSFILSCATILLFSDKATFPIRLLIHFIASAAGFYAIFILGGGYGKNSRTAFMAVILFVIFYLIVMAVVCGIRKLTSYKKTDNEPYRPNFK